LKGALLLDHFQCLAVQVVMQVSLKMTWRNHSLKSGETDLFFTFRISSQQAVFLTVPYPVAAARCSFQSLSTNTLMPASVSPNHSAKFQTVTVLSLGSGSGSSAFWKALRFRISKVWSSVSYWSWEFSDLKTSSASWALICLLGWIFWDWEQTTLRAERRKSGDDCKTWLL
jgi:hypothetical protein